MPRAEGPSEGPDLAKEPTKEGSQGAGESVPGTSVSGASSLQPSALRAVNGPAAWRHPGAG